MRAAALLVSFLAMLVATPPQSGAEPIQQGRLDNGLEVVVVPDRRVPVVTHVLAYRVGAADDPAGASGLAHFLEHLMYKSTRNTPAGVFARSISRLGGRENAVTSHDTTMYYQRVPREALRSVMALEADRMVNLRFDDDEVARERDVIIEERRQRIDLSPINLLNEQVAAALHPNHHYRVPVLGWRHEMSRLTRAQAEAFYKRYYQPANAVLVVQGDVALDEVLQLARETYGKLQPREAPGPESPAVDPEPIAARTVELSDARVAQSAVLVSYFVPLPPEPSSHLAETIEILARILAQGDASRMSASLIASQRLAIVCEGGTQASRDGLTVSIFATAARGTDVGRLRSAMLDEIARAAAGGITGDELERARAVIMAADLYAGDQHLTSTLRIADAIATGRTAAHINERAERLKRVTAGDVQAAATTYLSQARSVTGFLLPAASNTDTPSQIGEAGR